MQLCNCVWKPEPCQFIYTSLIIVSIISFIRTFEPTIAVLKAMLLSSTECKPNYELSSLPFAISVPVHDDTNKFQHSCKDTKMA